MTITDTGREVFEVVVSDSRRTPADRAALMHDPGFGRVHTDHMVSVRWTEEHGWHDAKLSAYAPLQLDPSAMVLHYGQAIFEGLKGYRQPDGGVAVFRPEENARRFNRSARRLAMPELPEELFVAAVERLVEVDVDWVPTAAGQSLYLRPFMIATEAQVGMRPAHEYLFLLIAFPVTPFFPGEVRPVTVWLSAEYVRAAVGGTGEAKCGGNYAGSLLAQRQAAEKGCDQVVWLDAVERRWVEEMGGMNLFFVFGGAGGGPVRLLTPALTGTLLPGVVRDSLLTLAPELGYLLKAVSPIPALEPEEEQRDEAGCQPHQAGEDGPDGEVEREHRAGAVAIGQPAAGELPECVGEKEGAEQEAGLAAGQAKVLANVVDDEAEAEAIEIQQDGHADGEDENDVTDDGRTHSSCQLSVDSCQCERGQCITRASRLPAPTGNWQLATAKCRLQ